MPEYEPTLALDLERTMQLRNRLPPSPRYATATYREEVDSSLQVTGFRHLKARAGRDPDAILQPLGTPYSVNADELHRAS
jgi:hypothetical protein